MSDKTLSDLKYDAHVAVLHTKVDSLIEKQKELTERVRANEKVVAAVTLLGTVVIAVIGAGYFAPKAEACSPFQNGGSTYCVPDLDVIDEVGLCKGDICPPLPQSPIVEETERPEYYKSYQIVTLVDTRGEPPSPSTWIHGLREWKSKQNRSSVEDSINNALAELEWEDTAEQEE